jgi:hypothetical protein
MENVGSELKREFKIKRAFISESSLGKSLSLKLFPAPCSSTYLTKQKVTLFSVIALAGLCVLKYYHTSNSLPPRRLTIPTSARFSTQAMNGDNYTSRGMASATTLPRIRKHEVDTNNPSTTDSGRRGSGRDHYVSISRHLLTVYLIQLYL